MQEINSVIKQKVSRMLIQLGFRMNRRGFDYMREIIAILFVKNMPLDEAAMHVARSFGVNIDTVVRACKSEIKNAYEFGVIQNLKEYWINDKGLELKAFIEITVKRLRADEI